MGKMTMFFLITFKNESYVNIRCIMGSTNSLGLDFAQLQMQELPPPSSPILRPEFVTTSTSPSHSEIPRPSQESEDHAELKDKKKPYANPERVKTGGNQRVSCTFKPRLLASSLACIKDKLSEEELVERMVRMREQNEKIKQRRMVFIVH
jgi:hypothetical protein